MSNFAFHPQMNSEECVFTRWSTEEILIVEAAKFDSAPCDRREGLAYWFERITSEGLGYDSGMYIVTVGPNDPHHANS